MTYKYSCGRIVELARKVALVLRAPDREQHGMGDIYQYHPFNPKSFLSPGLSDCQSASQYRLGHELHSPPLGRTLTFRKQNLARSVSSWK